MFLFYQNHLSYENSDGIEGIEEDNIEESDDEEEEESEKQFMRNLSDDG